MKTTITINLSNLLFHIEEDAYEKLKRYLGHIETHFKNMEGSHDILNDIESRIAELLKERLGKSREVVNSDDIDEIIIIIGNPDEIEGVGISMDKLELKFEETRRLLEEEIASKPDPWSASKAVDGLIKSGYFKLPNKRTMTEAIAALKEADPRAKNRDKIIFTTLKRRFDKGKLMGEKMDSGWVFWTT